MEALISASAPAGTAAPTRAEKGGLAGLFAKLLGEQAASEDPGSSEGESSESLPFPQGSAEQPGQHATKTPLPTDGRDGASDDDRDARLAFPLTATLVYPDFTVQLAAEPTLPVTDVAAPKSQNGAESPEPQPSAAPAEVDPASEVPLAKRSAGDAPSPWAASRETGEAGDAFVRSAEPTPLVRDNSAATEIVRAAAPARGDDPGIEPERPRRQAAPPDEHPTKPSEPVRETGPKGQWQPPTDLPSADPRLPRPVAEPPDVRPAQPESKDAADVVRQDSPRATEARPAAQPGPQRGIRMETGAAAIFEGEHLAAELEVRLRNEAPPESEPTVLHRKSTSFPQGLNRAESVRTGEPPQALPEAKSAPESPARPAAVEVAAKGDRRGDTVGMDPQRERAPEAPRPTPETDSISLKTRPEQRIPEAPRRAPAALPSLTADRPPEQPAKVLPARPEAVQPRVRAEERSVVESTHEPAPIPAPEPTTRRGDKHAPTRSQRSFPQVPVEQPVEEPSRAPRAIELEDDPGREPQPQASKFVAPQRSPKTAPSEAQPPQQTELAARTDDSRATAVKAEEIAAPSLPTPTASNTPEPAAAPRQSATVSTPPPAPSFDAPSFGEAKSETGRPDAAPQTSEAAFKHLEAALESTRTNSQKLQVVIRDEHLGRLSLRLVSRSGLIDMMVRADNPRTAQTVSEGLPALLESLAHKGFQSEAAGSNPSFSSNEQERRNESGGGRRRGQSDGQRRRAKQQTATFRIAS